MIVIQIREIMTRRPITATPATTLGEARRLLAEHRIRHVPVVLGGRLVGIVSDRDLRSATASHGPTTPVSLIMTRNVVTVTPQTRVDEAARIILAGRFGGLPVVEGDELVGIATETDLLRALIDVLETDASERIAVDFPGAA